MGIKDYWIGSLHCNEAFGEDTIKRLNQIPPIRSLDGQEYQIRAEHIIIDEVSIDYHTKYRLIIDRYSYLYPQAIGLFMGMAFRGVYLINNPFSFYYFINNKDASYIVAHELGINIPKTYVLPAKEAPLLQPEDFKYHKLVDWDKLTQELGWPIVIKPAAGREAIKVNIAYNLPELLNYYDESGSDIMLLQQKVNSKYQWQIRCLCIGKRIIPIKYIFGKMDSSQYIFDPNFLDEELGKKVVDSCKIINRSLGYEMNSVEFFIDEQQEIQAIDFNNPVPDGRLKALGQIFYEDYQQAICDLVIEIITKQSQSDFVPNQVNQFANLARRTDVSRTQKWQMALALANEYYES